MIIFNSNVLKFGGFWLGFGSSPTPPPTPTIYHITVPTVEHGTVSVNPTEGPTGTLVTISTVPDTGYELDTISLTGAELINGNQFYIDGSDVTVNVTFTAINYNPLNLPPYTIRVQIADGESVTPVYSSYTGTVRQVSASPNVWDLTYAQADWSYAFTWGNDHSTARCFKISNNNSLKKVLGFNSTGITNMHLLFDHCPSLTDVCAFDTRSVTDAAFMFNGCSSLKALPALDLSSATAWREFAHNCISIQSIPNLNPIRANQVYQAFSITPNVKSGILKFYNDAKNTVVNDYDHADACFNRCGFNWVEIEGHNTQVFASEESRQDRAQIPYISWGGDQGRT
jgi:hypothetical protein